MIHSKLAKMTDDNITVHSSLNLFQRHSFAGLVPASVRQKFIRGDEEDCKHIRSGIEHGGHPVAVAWLKTRGKKGHVVHCYVSKSYRRRGFGTRMMSVVEERLKAEGVDEVFAEYRRETQKGQQYADFLSTVGFINPELQRVKVRISTPQIKKASWWQPDRDLPRDFEIKSWSDVSEDKRGKLARQNWVPDALNPVQFDDVDGSLSNVLYHRSDVAGWFLMVNEGNGLFSISSAYIAPAHQKRFRLGLLIYATLSNAIKQGMEDLEFVVPGAFPSHIRFNERHTRHLADKFYYICSRMKKFTED